MHNLCLRLICCTIIAASSSSAVAEEVSFFGSKIDYWQTSAPESSGTSRGAATPERERSFAWNKYLDPQNDEFFKEGDYTPPAPFMEVARNPSDENIKLWVTYIEKKNALAERLQRKLREFAGQASPADHGPERSASNAEAENPRSNQPEINRYQFQMYFDSKCPHCKRMMGTIADLTKLGFEVDLRQTDDGPLDTGAIPIAVSKATAEEIARQGVSAVPFLLVSDTKKKVVYRLSGFQTVDEIFAKIRKS